jgi:hypothetical protein
MFVRQNQQQFRNSNADVQIFYGSGLASSGTQNTRSWTKPSGISNVYMMLIGAGGYGQSGVSGGGSGAVTVWYGAAKNVPDTLVVSPASIGFASGSGDAASNIYYRGRALSFLLAANSGSSGSGGTAMTANYFANSGFFQSVAGQSGDTAPVTRSNTTFLSGGGITGGDANYGYKSVQNTGYFQFQPIIVGVSADGSLSQGTNDTGIGCGGVYSVSISMKGGPGMILIASW